MSEAALKPCPFCGGGARCVDLAGWEIHCDCGAQLWRARPDKEALIAHWETRVDSSPDLLQMLHECAEYIAALNGEQDDYCQRARALIARATGASS